METSIDYKKELPYAYWLHNIKGVGNKGIRKLLKKVKLPSRLFFLTKEQLFKNYFEEEKCFTEKALEHIQKSKEMWNVEKEYLKLEKQKVGFFPEFHPSYPEALRKIPDAPWAIYVMGKLPDENKPTVAVIGARECSAYGAYMAKELGKKLAANGIQVVSGMAKGVDSLSQKAALEEDGEVFAVLGSGVDVCYPISSRQIYEQMKSRGGIISEYPLKTEPKPGNFPARNRIISGLANAVVVVEAKERSGTLITVDMALEQGREVYAVPGRGTDALSKGCNQLIRDGAGILFDVEEFITEIQKSYVNYEGGAGIKNGIMEQKLFASLNQLEQKILEIIDFYPKTLQKIYDELIDNVKYREEIELNKLMYTLLKLEKMGMIQTKGDNYLLKS
ncbi:MAG: DNA-processing protein DprA [Lachnospiraceae bacterium]|nr:DNA-processing protein DprA [Lachnospiraceae bacterium]